MASPRRRSRLRLIRDYLFADFEYVQRFGAELNYERYWDVRVDDPFELSADAEQYKRALISSYIEPASSVLEIGCGTGGLLLHLQQTRHADVIGVEVSRRAATVARDAGLTVLEADVSGGEIPGPDTVDYVVMSQVLEHLVNPEVVLDRLHGRVRKAILVDVPNVGAVNDRLRLLMGRFPKQWAYHAAEHVRFWTISDFKSMASQLGYEVVVVRGLIDEQFDYGVGLWRHWPSLFSRWVLYVLKERQER